MTGSLLDPILHGLVIGGYTNVGYRLNATVWLVVRSEARGEGKPSASQSRSRPNSPRKRAAA